MATSGDRNMAIDNRQQVCTLDVRGVVPIGVWLDWAVDYFTGDPANGHDTTGLAGRPNHEGVAFPGLIQVSTDCPISEYQAVSQKVPHAPFVGIHLE